MPVATSCELPGLPPSLVEWRVALTLDWLPADALYEIAESGCPANPPLVHIDPENPDEVPPVPPLPPRPNAQLNSIAARLGNNQLRNLDGLKEFLNHVLDDPQQLRWLDLSCNALTNVDLCLSDFPNLQARLCAIAMQAKLCWWGASVGPVHRAIEAAPGLAFVCSIECLA